MENASIKWRFEGNSKPYEPTELSIDVVFNWLIQSLREEDQRVVIPLGHGDLSSVPCHYTATAAEDAIVDAVRSARFKRYSPIFGIPEARRSLL